MKKLKAIFRFLMPVRFYDRMARCKWLFCMKMRHHCAKSRIRAKFRRGEKIRVVFLDSEITKWKCQSLYDEMKASEYFEPCIGLMRRAFSESNSLAERMSMVHAARNFYEKHGCTCVDLYDGTKDQHINLRAISPDIVFYQQPWSQEIEYNPRDVSAFALTCYVPYFVPSIGFPDMEAHRDFHRCLAFYFLLNRRWMEVYTHGVSRGFYSGSLIATGSPMLDPYNEPDPGCHPEYVIYAPHYSIGNDFAVRMATFQENGTDILRYAQAHSEIKWVFKPHPGLRFALQKYMGYSERQVQEYYDAWGEIGLVCEQGNYLGLFKNAKAMITDCGSFLAEFGATGRPIIHLISSRNNYVPCHPSLNLFASYYEVHNLDEMFKMFEIVLEKGQDPKKDVRQLAVNEARLTGTPAAKNIMRVLNDICGVEPRKNITASREYE